MTPPPFPLDEDALIASVDLIGRSGARDFTFAYLHDDVPLEQAGWWASATYQGAKIAEENHRGPLEAVEALARRILTGGMCTHCRGLIALSDGGAIAHVGATMLDGSVMTEERARSMPQCRWRREGKRWVRGCEAASPGRPSPFAYGPGPNRAERRRAKRSRR